MADKQVEIKARLTLDTLAAHILQGVRKEFEEVNEAREETQEGFSDFARSAAATALGVNLMPMVRSAVNAASSIVSVTAAVEEAGQGFAGLIAGMQGVPWEDAQLEGEILNDALRDTAYHAGQVDENVQGAFKSIATFLGGGARAFNVAKRNIGDLAIISSKTNIPLVELGQQTGKLAAGYVAMESPLFNLLRTTGIFHGDIRKVNEEWQKLTQAERVQRLEQALGNVAANLQKAEPSMEELMTSAQELGKSFLVSLGDPILRELIPALVGVREDVDGSRGEIEAFARSLGRDVGRWVREAGKDVREGFQFLMNHADEIRDAVREAFQFARDTVEWILAHKTELAIAFGAHALGGNRMVGQLAGGIGRAARGTFAAGAVGSGFARGVATTAAPFAPAAGAAAFGVAGRLGTATATALGAGSMVSAGGVAGGVAALGGLAVAVGAVTVALWGMHEAVEQSMGAKTDEAEAVQRAMDFFKNLEKSKAGGFEQFSDKELKQIDKMREQLVNVAGAKGLGESSRALGEWADSILAVHSANRSMVSRSELAVETLGKMELEQRKLSNKLADLTDSSQNLSRAYVEQEMLKLDEMLMRQQQDQSAVTEVIAAGYMEALRSNDAGAAQYIADLLTNSKDIQTTFLQSAQLTAVGFEELANMVRNKSQSFADMLDERAERARMEAEKPEAPRVAFNGGQVFKIQQDFRDADPDRVAIVFQKGILQSAQRRIQASTSTPFGT